MQDLIDRENDYPNRPQKRSKLRKMIFSLPTVFIILLLGVILAVIGGSKAVKGFKLRPSDIDCIAI